MRVFLMSAVVAAGLLTALAAQAQTPPSVTASCKDGTNYAGTTRKGACAGHGGVLAWTKAAPTATTTAAPPAAPAATAAAPATAPKPKASSTAVATSQPQGKPPAAAMGGPGQVWVNTSSKVYHCPGTTWYGKTKQGMMMSEADAQAKGFHADHGKACS